MGIVPSRASLPKGASDNNGMTRHMEVLQLSTLDEATFALRQLFVEELSDDYCSHWNFLRGSKEEIAAKANEFRTTGGFNRVWRCSNEGLLKYSSSTNNGDHFKSAVSYVPFFPEDPLSNDPIYVPYHYYGAGTMTQLRRWQQVKGKKSVMVKRNALRYRFMGTPVKVRTTFEPKIYTRLAKLEKLCSGKWAEVLDEIIEHLSRAQLTRSGIK